MKPETPGSDRPLGVSPIQRRVYLVLGLLFGGTFFYITARNVDIDEVLVATRAIKTGWILPLAVTYALTLIGRCVRWRYMFPDYNRPSLRHAFDAGFLGRLANLLVPGRLGELVRAAVAGKLYPEIGMTGSLATIVVEKIYDLLAVLALLGIALFFAPLPQWLISAGVTLITIVVGLLLALWVLDRVGDKFLATAQAKMSGGRFFRLQDFILGLMQKFSTGLFALRNAQHASLVVMQTVMIWLLDVAVVYLCFQAFSIPAPFMAAVVATVFFCIGSLLPTAPGFIGTYQLFFMAALQLYAVPESTAFAMSIFFNLVVIVVTLLLGLAVVLLDGGVINIRKMLFSPSS